MIAVKRAFAAFLLGACALLPLAALADCVHTAEAAAMAQASSATLNALLAGQTPSSRNAAILAVALAGEGKLDERAFMTLGQHASAYPDDLTSKLYEGYAWVFSAGEFQRRKNYLRAAEDLKRGFFLIDEAVDSAPDNWRLRYLRLRMDAFVPAQLGRYVIALKDAGILVEALPGLPVQMPPLILALRAAALERAGDPAAAQRAFEAVRAQFPESPIAALSAVCALQGFITEEEIASVLVPLLEAAP